MRQPENRIQKMVEPLKTGELLVKEGFVGQDDIEKALLIQKKRSESMSTKKNRFLGMILCDLNLLTPVDNFYVLYKYNKAQTLKSALLSENKISSQVLENNCILSRKKNIPLISYLLKSGLVSTHDMQQILFDLFHVPLRSLRDFVFNTKDKESLIKVLGQQQSRENRIVPMMLKENTILLGITDPDNMMFVHQLNEKFPQYRFKVVFIPYWGFGQLNQTIYSASLEKKPFKSRSLDLSFLLKFKTSVTDPAREKDAIQTLYQRYEQLHHLAGSQKKENRQDDFNRFIQLVHEKITREYKSRSIEFSLKKEENGVKIIAFPKR